MTRLRIWITRLDARAAARPTSRALEARDPDSLPLYGVPFAIKDNIDLAGVPTTAGCPEFAYTPQRSATVVAAADRRRRDSARQDQPRPVRHRPQRHALAVRRVPQQFRSGLHRRRLQLRLGGRDRARSGELRARHRHRRLRARAGGVQQPGRAQADARAAQHARRGAGLPHARLRVGVRAHRGRRAGGAGRGRRFRCARSVLASRAPGPRAAGAALPLRRAEAAQLEFFGNREYAALFDAAVARLTALGGERVEIDLAPFLEAARLLYEGPWVAERYVAIRDFIESKPEALHPVTRAVIEKGRPPSAVDTFAAMYRLAELRAHGRADSRKRRCHRHPDRRHHLPHRRTRGRPAAAQQQPRLLHQLHEPARSRRGRGAGGFHRSWAAIRHHAVRRRVSRARAARSCSAA